MQSPRGLSLFFFCSQSFPASGWFFVLFCFLLFSQFLLIGGKFLYNIVVIFAIYQHESPTGAHVSPHPEKPSNLPLHAIHLGYPRAPALSALLHALKLHWSCFIYSYVHVSVLFLKSSHPHLFLLGASARNSAHGKGHEEGGFGIRKGRIEPQETPCSRTSTPKTRVCFMLSPIPLTLQGGCSPTTSLGEGVNLQLQLIKIPESDKSVSTYKLLWRFSSLPEQVRPATCDCLQPPNHERHKML